MKMTKKTWCIVLIVVLCLAILAVALWFWTRRAGVAGAPQNAGDTPTEQTVPALPDQATGQDNEIEDPWDDEEPPEGQPPEKPAPDGKTQPPEKPEKAPVGDEGGPVISNDEDLATSDEGWTKPS